MRPGAPAAQTLCHALTRSDLRARQCVSGVWLQRVGGQAEILQGLGQRVEPAVDGVVAVVMGAEPDPDDGELVEPVAVTTTDVSGSLWVTFRRARRIRRSPITALGVRSAADASTPVHLRPPCLSSL
jgi:hypothetical protein